MLTYTIQELDILIKQNRDVLDDRRNKLTELKRVLGHELLFIEAVEVNQGALERERDRLVKERDECGSQDAKR